MFIIVVAQFLTIINFFNPFKPFNPFLTAFYNLTLKLATLQPTTTWKVFKYRVFFWSVFSCIRTEYVDLWGLLENTDQNKLCIWTIFTQCTLKVLHKWPHTNVMSIFCSKHKWYEIQKCAGIIKFVFCLYTYIFIHGDIFWTHWIRRDHKVVEYSILSKMSETIKFLSKNICKWKYAAFVSYFLARCVIFHPF